MRNRPVLFIDDNPRMQELVTAILRGTDFKVLWASDGPAGIELAQRAQPALILVDMMMPGLDGISVCKQLRQKPALKDIPVVVMTSSDDLSVVPKAFQAGAAFFLPKPFPTAALLQVVELALASAAREPTSSNRRQHPRLPVGVPVRCRADAKGALSPQVEGYTGNASLGGLLLLLPEKLLGQGMAVTLELTLPEGSVSAKSTVVWCDPIPDEEGRFRHGVRLLGFVNDASFVAYGHHLTQVAAGHTA